jgi:hypothetical protein
VRNSRSLFELPRSTARSKSERGAGGEGIFQFVSVVMPVKADFDDEYL